MTFLEMNKWLLAGYAVKRPHWPVSVKLGKIQPQNPKRDSLEFLFPVITDNNAENIYRFTLEDVTATDYESVTASEPPKQHP